MNQEIFQPNSLIESHAHPRLEFISHGPRMNPESHYGAPQEFLSVISDQSGISESQNKRIPVMSPGLEGEISQSSSDKKPRILHIDTRIDERYFFLKSLSGRASLPSKNIGFLQGLLLFKFFRCIRNKQRRKLIQNGLKESSLKEILFKQKISLVFCSIWE